MNDKAPEFYKVPIESLIECIPAANPSYGKLNDFTNLILSVEGDETKSLLQKRNDLARIFEIAESEPDWFYYRNMGHYTLYMD